MSVTSTSSECKTAFNETTHLSQLQRRGHGVIEAAAGRVERVTRRRWPTTVVAASLFAPTSFGKLRGAPDRCRLYFNQPRSCPNYLTLKFVATTPGTSYATFRAALIGLDALAQLRGIDAIVCEAANPRISERLLARLGWERHHLRSRRRHYIKRFYGEYPAGLEGVIAAVLGSSDH